MIKNWNETGTTEDQEELLDYLKWNFDSDVRTLDKGNYLHEDTFVHKGRDIAESVSEAYGEIVRNELSDWLANRVVEKLIKDGVIKKEKNR